MQCIEQSIVSSCEKKIREGLDKAKDASSKERNLIRLQEQTSLSDSHNLDLTFAVSNDAKYIFQNLFNILIIFF